MHTFLFLNSLVISILVLIASILGIFNPTTYQYETANWTLQAIGQDIGNLIAVLLFIIGSLLLIYKSTKAFLVWVGVLFYFIYAYLIYAFFIHFNYLFLIYTAILGLSVYSTILGFMHFTHRVKLAHERQARFAGIVLILTGLLFIMLWLTEIVPALLNSRQPASLKDTGLWVNPIHVIDLAVVLPGMVSTGILLLRKNKWGYLYAAPWLTFSILMGSSIIMTLILMFFQGDKTALVPLVMVSTIVCLSIVALYQFFFRPNHA